MKLYIKNNGKILGPLDWDRILTLHKNGRLSSDVTVSEDKNNWLTIEQVIQLTEQDSGTSAQSSSLSTVGNSSLPQSTLRLRQEGDQQTSYMPTQQPDIIPQIQQSGYMQAQQTNMLQPQQSGYFASQQSNMTSQQLGINQSQQVRAQQNISNSNNNLKLILLFFIGVIVVGLVLCFCLMHKDYFIKGDNTTTEQNVPKKENDNPTVEQHTPQKKKNRISTSGLYASQISSIMSDFSHRDMMANNIYQQICNGTYRTVELLNILAKQKGCSTSGIMSNFSHRDTMADNINQQICNGKYRTVELLDAIAQHMGCSTSDIMSNFSHRDTMADNINQQICNGTYRTVELLNLIVKKIDE